MGRIPTMSPSSPEAAFESAQREECSAVYGDASDLKVLMDALRKSQHPFRVSLIWETPEDVDRAAAEIATQKADEEKRKLALQQHQRDIEAIRRDQSAEDAKKKENQQKALQAKYGRIAVARAAEIANDVRAAMDSPLGTSEESARALAQYREFFAWYNEQVRDRWDLLKFESNLADYGIASFKGRDLETAFARISLRLSNRIVGDYKDACFIFARENDSEFKVQREPFVTRCDSISEISSWKRAHEFRSEWLVE